ncbi:MAG: adenosylcobinamide-GDP ribazoletransferase, partial [Bacteroidales bacterium]|nr:adenosylcobinamide-GDP ribazoletransferase [Bacteroidales bacterium]
MLIHYMRHKIQGYTGDCCGAIFLLTELSFLLASVALINTL